MISPFSYICWNKSYVQNCNFKRMSYKNRINAKSAFFFYSFLSCITRGNKHCVHKKLLYGALILGIGGQFGCRQNNSLYQPFQKPDSKNNKISGSVSDSINNKTDDQKNITELDKMIFCYVVEVMPEFPGGDEARVKFLKKNLIYPDSARKHGIQGTVFATFTVDTNGSVSNPKILRGIGYGCDEEAIRVLKLMPKWKPSLQENKAVLFRMNLPVKFALPDSTQTR